MAALLAAQRRRSAPPSPSRRRGSDAAREPGPHWFWLTDLLLHRTALFDADTGDMLGRDQLGHGRASGSSCRRSSRPTRRSTSPRSYYSRGVRGDRTDVVTVYDARTLQPCTRSRIPPKRAEYFPGNAANALSDDGRFMAVFNLTPMTSLSIVDVQRAALRRRGADARVQPRLRGGAAPLPHAVRERRRAHRDRRRGGRRADASTRTTQFFDPNKDPLTEKAVRRGNEWLFVSFEGMIHPVDVSGRRCASARSGRWSTTRTARPTGASAADSTSPCTPRRAGSTRSCTRAARIRTRTRGRRCGSTTSPGARRVQRHHGDEPAPSFVGQQMGLASRGRAGGSFALAPRSACCRTRASSASPSRRTTSRCWSHGAPHAAHGDGPRRDDAARSCARSSEPGIAGTPSITP